jgi:hypothetical protein
MSVQRRMTLQRLRLLLRPRGIAAFVGCARAQHYYLHQSWPLAIRVAWLYGTVGKR